MAVKFLDLVSRGVNAALGNPWSFCHQQLSKEKVMCSSGAKVVGSRCESLKNSSDAKLSPQVFVNLCSRGSGWGHHTAEETVMGGHTYPQGSYQCERRKGT